MSRSAAGGLLEPTDRRPAAWVRVRAASRRSRSFGMRTLGRETMRWSGTRGCRPSVCSWPMMWSARYCSSPPSSCTRRRSAAPRARAHTPRRPAELAAADGRPSTAVTAARAGLVTHVVTHVVTASSPQRVLATSPMSSPMSSPHRHRSACWPRVCSQPITYARDEATALAFLAGQRSVRSRVKASY